MHMSFGAWLQRCNVATTTKKKHHDVHGYCPCHVYIFPFPICLTWQFLLPSCISPWSCKLMFILLKSRFLAWYKSFIVAAWFVWRRFCITTTWRSGPTLAKQAQLQQYLEGRNEGKKERRKSLKKNLIPILTWEYNYTRLIAIALMQMISSNLKL